MKHLSGVVQGVQINRGLVDEVEVGDNDAARAVVGDHLVRVVELLRRVGTPFCNFSKTFNNRLVSIMFIQRLF